jgi:hypothetical protein
MKKIVMVLFVCLFTMTNGVTAQDRGGKNGGKILELNKAFLQEKLALSDHEMAKFWTIHVDYITERRSVNKAMKAVKNKVKNNDNLSEAEFGKLVDELSDLRMDEIKNDKLYAKSAVTIIGVNKFKELKPLAKEFKEEMRKKRDARSGGEGRPGRDGSRPNREGNDR